jgi:hypothetical protein
MALSMKMAVFWVVVPCRLAEYYTAQLPSRQRFYIEINCLEVHVWRNSVIQPEVHSLFRALMKICENPAETPLRYNIT